MSSTQTKVSALFDILDSLSHSSSSNRSVSVFSSTSLASQVEGSSNANHGCQSCPDFSKIETPPQSLFSIASRLTSSTLPPPILSHLRTLSSSRSLLLSQIQAKKHYEMAERLEREMEVWVRERDWERVVEGLGVVRGEWDVPLGDANLNKDKRQNEGVSSFASESQGSDGGANTTTTATTTRVHTPASQRNYALTLLIDEFEQVIANQQHQSLHANDSDILKYVKWIGRLGAPIPSLFLEHLQADARRELSQELSQIDDFTQRIHVIMDYMAGEVERQEAFLLETFGYEQFARFVLDMQTLTDELCQETIHAMVKERDFASKVRRIDEWRQREARKNKSGHTRTASASERHALASQQQSATDAALIGDLDKILEEITVICSKIEMYARFMDNKLLMALKKHGVAKTSRSTSSTSPASAGAALMRSSSASNQVVPTPTSADTPSSAAQKPQDPSFTNATAMTQIKKELSLHYLQMEHQFLELSIAKAINLNAQQQQNAAQATHAYFGASNEDVSQLNDNDSSFSDLDSSSDISDDEATEKHSSLVNDLFFIIRKSIHRACNTFSQDTVCKVLNDVHEVLHDTVRPELSQAIKQYVRKSSRPGDSVQYTTHQLRAISVSLNDLRICSEYMHKMKQEVMQQAQNLFAHEAQENIKHFANQLLKLSTEFKDSVEENIHTLVLCSFEQPLNEALDPFRETKYDINDAEFSQYEVNDPFVDQFSEIVEEWIEPFHEHFIQANYEHFVFEVVKVTVQLLMHVIVEERKSFSQLGGIQLDKDLRSLIRYFGEKTEISIRDKFADLNQIAFILKVNSLGEMLEFWNDSTMQSIWKFKDAERVRRILALRTDLDQQQVKALHL
eukprot:CAMPEP_0117436952 /NCGR_PEP_ID=MMETSP0759-20121206/1273_1 /TAXON_ID=63605 /ORGANISM="Percolomonas cosmopolitus, Strain WS" /LENGTH=853 /DNA_ID=CAMNT_0005228569 /DNA_START=5 /DNA_END=2566 /DNA_ORIENTATION=-